MLDPEQLRNFLHVVDAGSLSKAAGRAHVTQPALSRQVQLLEEQLGCELFLRTARGMQVTAAGRRLEQRARPLLSQLEGLRDEFLRSPVSGPLSVGVSPSVGMTWTARQMRRFAARFPRVQLRVVVLLSGAMAEAIERGRLDVGVLYTPLPDASQFRSRALWQEPAYFVCRRDHPRARAASISCRRLLASPLILPTASFGIRALLEQRAAALSMALRPHLSVDSLQLGLELVRQGAGNMVLGERAVADAEARDLAAVAVVRPSLVRCAHLATSETSLLRPCVRALWDFLPQPLAARPAPRAAALP